MTSTPKTPHFRRAPHASGLRAAACAEAGCAASEGPRRDDFEALFALADRRKRTRTPSANDLFLAAQSLRALGHIDAAQQELGAALSLDPGDLALDRAALSWGGTSARRAAAGRMVVRDDLDPSLRARAAAAMLEAGAEAAQSWRRTSKGVAGWIVWSGGGPLELEFEADAETQTFLVDSDPDHPLAGPGVAAADVQIETASEGPLVLRLQGRGVAPAHLRALRPPASLAALDAVSLTIVVPVYDDLFATRACLEALRKSPPSLSHRVIAVDDDSPDAEIRAYLEEAAAAGVITLVRNTENLGYARSVNRALALCPQGDVLLLNADALPPPGAIDRLAALSRAAPDVGALTPFSNNGELTSYPVRHAANPLPDFEHIVTLDALARAVNGDALVDLPNGVGFCLYLTRACLDAVGPLPEVYGQGYYEDVEFCLRARQRGFRTVAAPGVYVGHAGSRSFGERKGALVSRNLKRIEARFPGFQLESAAFVALDPLRPYRAALDLAAPPAGPVVLVACGPRAAARLGRLRAEEIARARPGDAVLILTADPRGRVTLSRSGGGAPQALEFDEPGACAAFLAKIDLRRIDCLDPGSLPDVILSGLIARNADFALPCGDLGWFAATPAPPEGPCIAAGADGPCDVCRALVAPGDDGRRVKLGRALERAVHIVPLDRLADSFVRRVFKTRVVVFDSPLPSPVSSVKPKTRIGVLCPHPTPAIDRLLRCFAGGDGPEFVVFGESLNDRALMARGRAFVTGPVDAQDYAETARRYRVDALLSPDRSGGFGELERTAAEIGVPKAYFDWSFGALAPAFGDLSLDPRICDEKAVARIDAWASAGEPASL
jgi:GT2 family glycosyltransferase